MTTTENTTRSLNDLVDERIYATNMIAEWTERLHALDGLILQHIGPGEKHEIADGVGVRIQAPSARFDARAAKETLTPEQYAGICVPKPDSATAKRVLPGALYDLCRAATGDPTVRVL